MHSSRRIGSLLRAGLALVCLAGLPGCNCGGRLQTTNGRLEVQPPSLDFGPRLAGSASTLSVTLSNTGSAPLALTARLERDARGAFSSGAAPTRLETGARATLAVTYVAPLSEGADGVSLVIDSDSATTPEVVVSVSGRSVGSSADAGPPDAGPPDAGPPDAGTSDGGPPDAGPADAGPADAGPPDGGPPDGGQACPGAPANVLLTPSSRFSWAPQLTWNGTDDLLTYVASNSGATNLDAARLTPAGSLGAAATLVPGAAYGRAAYSGAGYGVVISRWTGTSTGADVVFSRLTAAAVPVPSSETLFPRIRAFQTEPAVAWNPVSRQWGVVWREWNNGGVVVFRFARLTEAGALLAGSLVELGTCTIDGLGSILAFGAGGFAMLRSAPSPDRLELVRVDGSGTVSYSTIASLGAAVTPRAHSVAWNGAQLGLLWVAHTGATAAVHFARADSAGALVAGSDRVLHSFSTNEAATADLAASGTGWVAAWSAPPPGQANTDLYVARLDAAGNLGAGSPQQLSCAPERDSTPRWSAVPGPARLVWAREPAAGPELRTALIP